MHLTAMNRKKINQQIYARAVVIDDDKTPLHALLSHYNVESVAALSDAQAEEIHRELGKLLRNNYFTKEQNGCTKKQEKKLFKMAFLLNWQKNILFNFILNSIGNLRDKLTTNHIDKKNINALFAKLTIHQAANIIRQLENIHKKDNNATN